VRDFKALTAAAAADLAALVVCWTSAVVIGRRRIPRIRQCDTIESLAAEPIGQGGRQIFFYAACAAQTTPTGSRAQFVSTGIAF